MSIINSQPRIGAAGQSTGFKIERSLRFNSADSAYLNRTPASAGNRQTWTWSGWIKLGAIGGSRQLFSGGAGVSDQIFISDPPKLFVYLDGANRIESTPLYRDPSAWYHIVVAVDTTQATSSNRTKLYVNGVQVTDFTGTAITQNNNTKINDAVSHTIGRYAASAAEYFSGYMTEVYFLDGSTPTTTTRTVGGVTETVLTQFGEFDTDTGVWKPKAYSGSYGTNGFYLKFADNSGTTSTTLGKDSSGNGNNWTPNNFYVGPGTTNAEKAGIDSLVDTPTPYGTDTGAGGEVRGNYCTLNPVNGSGTIANGNLDHRATTTTWVNAPGTILVTSGKWYWESTAVGSSYKMIGIATSAASKSTDYGSPTETWTYREDATKFGGGNAGVSYGATFADGDVIGVALDMDAGTLVFYKNGVSQGTAFNTGISGKTIGPWVGAYNSNVGTNNNFGQRPFAYTAPSGFKALCTQNLPTPTIGATATTRADDYFNTVLYTGTGSSLSVTGVGFQPDWTWIKSRSAATDHGLYDAVRGVQKQLESNNTDAETTETTGLTAFNSDGFTVGALAQLNTNTATYVAWNWNAGGSNQTISVSQYSSNVPSIASTVRANTTAGFSIVTYTGTGSNATVGHGLGVAPQMIIIKNRTGSGVTSGWGVYHVGIGATKYLALEQTAAAGTSSALWQDTAPTSTVFSLGTEQWVNTNGGSHVAYCFAPVAGYSAFGSYTGNGADDGPFIFTGFRPAFVLIKCTSATGDWTITDSKRNTYNVVNTTLFPNLSNADTTGYDRDFLSNGFKIRNNGGVNNTNGGTYVYAAFAEVPQKFSLGR